METSIQHPGDVAITKQLFTDIFRGEKAGKVQLFFLSDVLNKYRDKSGYKIIRTDTSGRVTKVGGWSLDFGISGKADCFVHTALDSFTARVPETEHEHWLPFLVSLPFSTNYSKGLVRTSCLDDGAIRVW